ncbi:MAG: hypothetical protein Q4G14_05400 [Paracoccus sp. (in: a-proteobacteria)]|uniref:hypothetical protein n=1 Tax=Paracoccus sp. TaxID=267 RepID=UPI0026DF90E9|nr:hypothetical protein [Paracoccus sp. (in: a-proteobacteria)]MDO5612663.1 hypothetical protein [Paracoccus sp. (in: a-proteobacteria)]
MRFAPGERQVLPGAKFVGPMVVQRLEEAGFCGLASLAKADAETICRGTAAALGTTCWANSPQARRAVENAIAAARAAG